MKARVFVSMKPSVLDPQGQTVCASLQKLGHHEILDVRQGKYFELTLDPKVSRETAERTLEAVGRDVLANGVIEEYRVEIGD